MTERWCWRCKMVVPMLDEEEFAVAFTLYSAAFKMTGKTMKKRFEPLLEYHEKVTGFRETIPNVIMHHRIEQYGPDCENCGKPYRTPEASYCPACGNKRNAQK